MWKEDVVTSIRNLTETYSAMHKAQDVRDISQFMTQYTRTINKFMDTWLLAQMFQSENTGMSASVLYLGSLHSLNIEKYLERYGYKKVSIHESENLSACLTIKNNKNLDNNSGQTVKHRSDRSTSASHCWLA